MALPQDLNPQQEEAVKQTQGPLLIVAGSGSGKTRVITNKVAHLIDQGVSPENILALTFTDKAAEEMLHRVEELTDFRGELQISTFHSFCKELITDNILDLKLNANFRVITDTTQLVFFLRHIDDLGIESVDYGSNPVTLVEEIKRTISRLKDELITPEDLEEYIEREEADNPEAEELAGMRDILRAYRAYEDYKERNDMLDFGDLIIRVHQLLEGDPEIRRYYEERYRYVLVDEFQDTNYVQLQIVRLLAEGHRNVTAVGDDDQSIYRFRGAYLSNLEEFERLFPESEEVFLERNYRSREKILRAANRLVSHNPDRMEKTLYSRSRSGEVTAAVCSTENAQADYVAGEIEKLLEAYEPEDIAVLFRRRVDARPITRALEARAIPAEFIGDSGFFRQPVIKDVISFLRVLDSPAAHGSELARIMHMDAFGLKRSDISRITNHAREQKVPIYEALGDHEGLGVDHGKVAFFLGELKRLVAKKNKLTLLDLVYEVLFSLPFYRHETMVGDEKDIAHLNKFYRLASEYDEQFANDDLGDFLEYLRYASSFQLLEEDVEKARGAVNLMTVHQAKGKEYPVAFIPDLVEPRFPTRYRRPKFEIPEELLRGVRADKGEKELHVEEERRLLYVAMTRAMESLYLCTVTRYSGNKRDSKPSRFLEEIGLGESGDIEVVGHEEERLGVEEEGVEARVRRELEREAVASLHRGDYRDAMEKTVALAKLGGHDNVRELLEGIGEPEVEDLIGRVEEEKLRGEDEGELPMTFSASQFGTYKRCPRIYKYRYLYGIPTKPKPYFDFGATLHRVVECITRLEARGREVDLDTAIELLDRHWRTRGYTSKEQERRDYEEAKEILKIFLEENARVQGETVGMEKKFTVNLDGSDIYGVIDRVDREGGELVVLDYKTSKSTLSKNKLREDLQLLTYTLGAEKIYGEKPSRVGLWYLRKNKVVMVEVDEGDVEKVKEEVKGIIESIMEGDFEPRPGWECRNCDYDMLCDA